MSGILELEWENQNGITSYPFLEDQLFDNLITDASFVQFNNFVPILNYMLVSNNSLEINVTLDSGTSLFTINQSDFVAGLNYIRLITGNRYQGRISFGVGLNELWTNYVGQQITYNLPFSPVTVKSISSTCGVFELLGVKGDIEFTRTVSDENIFYNTISGQITFNAVKNNQFLLNPPPIALKQINLVKPIDNNIFLSTSDVLQINGTGIGQLNISLIGSSNSNLFTNLNPIATTLGF